MSTIRATTGQAVYKIERFLGMNENPDGDTKLKLGEASICRNWKVTRDRNLQRRPGFHTKVDIGTNAPVMGMWFGNIHGVETGLAASGGYMWKFYEDGYLEEPKRLGQIDTTNPVSFFAFNERQDVDFLVHRKRLYQTETALRQKFSEYSSVRISTSVPYKSKIILRYIRVPPGKRSFPILYHKNPESLYT